MYLQAVGKKVEWCPLRYIQQAGRWYTRVEIDAEIFMREWNSTESSRTEARHTKTTTNRDTNHSHRGERREGGVLRMPFPLSVKRNLALVTIAMAT